MATEAATPSRLSAIPRGIWALGLVSLFMDLSSEMIHALLPWRSTQQCRSRSSA